MAQSMCRVKHTEHQWRTSGQKQCLFLLSLRLWVGVVPMAVLCLRYISAMSQLCLRQAKKLMDFRFEVVCKLVAKKVLCFSSFLFCKAGW